VSWYGIDARRVGESLALDRVGNSNAYAEQDDANWAQIAISSGICAAIFPTACGIVRARNTPSESRRELESAGNHKSKIKNQEWIEWRALRTFVRCANYGGQARLVDVCLEERAETRRPSLLAFDV